MYQHRVKNPKLKKKKRRKPSTVVSKKPKISIKMKVDKMIILIMKKIGSNPLSISIELP